MWPAEGSVCQIMIPLLARHGIRWIATDEEILSASTAGAVSRDGKGHVNKPEMLYRPYQIREGESELGIVFRDHALSDLIGFHYQHSPAESAADDFMNCLNGISQAVGGDAPALVSVILDGENCWEHYPGGGVDFLRALYRRASTTPGVRPVRIGEFLEQHPPTETLPRLFAGSWISHNFAIWIGHEEDNTAWDALHRAREHLLKPRPTNGRSCKRGPPATPLERAWRELYIAEGSDWFWWYGDDHSSAQDALFDYLFRKHLQNVYRLAGRTNRRSDLSRPISRTRPQRLSTYTLPRRFPDVRIDGRATFFEWGQHARCHALPERTRYDGDGDARPAGGIVLRLRPRPPADPRRLRPAGPRGQAMADCDFLARNRLRGAGRVRNPLAFTIPAGRIRPWS